MKSPHETDNAMFLSSKIKNTMPAEEQVLQSSDESDESLALSDREAQTDLPAPQKHSKPKLLLLDLAPSVVATIESKWADVVVGTLGRPYKVDQTAGYTPAINHEFLSGHQECDIIIADFTFPAIDDSSPGEKHVPPQELDVWVKKNLGYIDNRGLTALRNRDVFERTLKQGGVIIVFADLVQEHDAKFASTDYGNRLTPGRKLSFSVWNLTSDLESLTLDDDHGSVTTAVDGSSLGKLVTKHLPGSEFTCAIRPRYPTDEWTALAVNKFNGWVAAGLQKEGRLVTLVVPQLANKAAFLDELLTTVLPEYLPDLFPDIATGAWTHRPEYELPRVAELRSERIRIEEETRAALAALDGQIDAEKIENGWIHDLLTATGDELVNAVKRALTEMGFRKVVDVDEIRDQAKQSRREDLRIEDRHPVLVVDIKGIGGRPTDEDATQANKHALIHSRESKNPEVQGLSIINHERHMPPLERDNNMPFREELLTVADETSLGLMTSFDLYRILVNMRRWKWTSGDVTPLLYASKRVSVVPTHYEFIGSIAGVWSKANAFGVVIENGAVNVGDTLAIEGPIYFEELTVRSIRVNDAAVQTATIADQAGFPLPESGAKIREGMRVFVIHRTEQVVEQKN
ncbi:hypothetical protein WI95_06235 [Burkholderia contaminans]|nr:hypothetical protein WI95_06235 [Burkholderia contaminans]